MKARLMMGLVMVSMNINANSLLAADHSPSIQTLNYNKFDTQSKALYNETTRSPGKIYRGFGLSSRSLGVSVCYTDFNPSEIERECPNRRIIFKKSSSVYF